MINIKFSSLNRIWVLSKSAKLGNFCFSIPDANLINSINQLIGILNTIEINSNNDLKYFDFPINQSELKGFREFQYREIWRFGSYVLFFCNLEKILKKVYSIIKKQIHKLNLKIIKNDKSELQSREKEILGIIKYRNKIFAHTAFGSPENNDSPSMQKTSLDYLAGGVFGLSKETGGVEFGGIWCGESDGKEQGFSNMNFSLLTKISLSYISAWFTVYEKMVNGFLKISDEEIMKLNPEITKLIRE